MEITDEKYKEAQRILLDTELKFKEEVGGEDRYYWQGRKDASRLLYGIFVDDYKPKADFLLSSSPGYIPLDNQQVSELVEDMVYNIAAILYELDNMKRVDIRTKLNLRRCVEDYDRLAEKGLLPVIDDHCLSRD